MYAIRSYYASCRRRFFRAGPVRRMLLYPWFGFSCIGVFFNPSGPCQGRRGLFALVELVFVYQGLGLFRNGIGLGVGGGIVAVVDDLLVLGNLRLGGLGNLFV